MAATKEAPVTTTTDPNAAMAAAIAEGIRSGIMQMNKPQIKEGDQEYEERLRAEGIRDEWEKPVFQNGYEADPRGESKETQHRAVRIATGSYINGRVHVDNTPRAVFFRYPTVSVDDRMKNKDLWRSFGELVDKLWAEMHARTAA